MLFHFHEHYCVLDPEVINIKTRVHVLISGRVQGVWFRANTKEKAEQLGINGWVRNTSDGKVEAIFEGDQNNIEQMSKWCKKGPELANVIDVNINSEEVSGEFEGFKIIY